MNQTGIHHSTDVLVIGGGIAGCFAAMKAKAAGADTLLVDKGYVSSSGQTPFADSFCIFDENNGANMDEWLDAIGKAGEYVNNRAWTKEILKGTRPLFDEMCSFGVEFIKNKQGETRLTPVDNSPFMVAMVKNKTKSCQILRTEVIKSGATIMDRIMITDLIKVGDTVCGAVGMSVTEGDFHIFHAKAVILATGASCLKCTGWPNSGLTADGDMMAYRAGAIISGKEYNDPHTIDFPNPNCIGPGFLRKKDGTPQPPVFKNALGELVYSPSIFHMSIEFEAHAGHAPIRWEVGPPPVRGMEVMSGASIGMSNHKSEGIWPSDLEGGTGITGLFAAGDALNVMLCGALYATPGAAFPGSGVIGSIAGRAAARYAQVAPELTPAEENITPLRTRAYAPLERKGGFSPDWVLQLLNNLMVPYFVLTIKHEERLQATLSMLTFYREHLVPKLNAVDVHDLRLALECDNLAQNCEMKLRSALMRKESRGTHYREDYPDRNDEEWLAWILIRDNNGVMELTKEMVPEEWRPDSSLTPEERYPVRFPVFNKEGGRE